MPYVYQVGSWFYVGTLRLVSRLAKDDVRGAPDVRAFCDEREWSSVTCANMAVSTFAPWSMCVSQTSTSTC
jgi:hypothetical protein